MPDVAIYHFTDGSEIRPKIYEDQIEKLKQYAIDHGWDIKKVYCDYSIKKCERKEFERFLSEFDKYDILIVKDFYHINKNTMECMRIMQYLIDNGIKICSLENGKVKFEDVPFDQPLRVATYNCRFGAPNEIKQAIQVQNDIFKLFINKKTNWILLEQYSDESEHQNDAEQKQLIELIRNRDKYDLVVVNNLNDIHWRTSKFCKRREDFQLDIYSMQDGFLSYRKANHDRE